MKKITLILCLIMIGSLTNAQSYEDKPQPVKFILAAGFQNAFGFAPNVFFKQPLYVNPIFAIPQASFRVGNQIIRGSLDIGAENCIGFEVGKYFHFGLQGGYSIAYNSWLSRAHIGGRIPLDSRQRHHLIIEHGVQLNGATYNGVAASGFYVWVIPIRIGLQFNLTNK